MQSFTKKSSPKTQFNTDLIWQILAFGLLVGVVFFYLGGLQPLVLTKYTDGMQSQVDRLESKLADQTNSFSDIELRILGKVKIFNPTEVCSTSQVVDTEDSDFQELADFKTNLLPDQRLQTSPRYYSMFYIKQIEDKYSDLYSKYESVLTQYNNVYNNSLNLKDFLNYRNSFIDTCQKIQNSKGSLNDLRDFCTLQNSNYKDFSDKNIFSDTSKQIQPSLDKCNDVISYADKAVNKTKTTFPNYNKWFLDWYTGFQNIMLYSTNFIPGISDLSGVTNDFKLELNTQRDNITSFTASKSSFTGKFYLIDYSLN